MFQRKIKKILGLVCLAVSVIFYFHESFVKRRQEEVVQQRQLIRRKTWQKDDWTDVPGAGGKWLVYAAHISETPNSEARVAVVTALDQTLKVKTAYCHVWNSPTSYITSKGKMTQLREGVHRFTTALVWCSLKKFEKVKFLRVTISTNQNTILNFSDSLPINGFKKTFQRVKMSLQDEPSREKRQRSEATTAQKSSKVIQQTAHEINSQAERQRTRNRTDDLAVCVRAMFGAYNDAIRVIEFIEFLKILGAKFFFFYKYSIGADVEKVLQFYVKKKEAAVLPWSIPKSVAKAIHAYGQLASQNDCLLRASTFSFVAMLDIDEMFVPRKDRSLVNMLNRLDLYSSYMFRNAFFYNFWEDDASFVPPNITAEAFKCSSTMNKEQPFVRTLNSTNENTLNATTNLFLEDACSAHMDCALVTLRKTRRLASPSALYIRPKFIVRPKHVAVVDVHKVYEFQKGIPRRKQTYSVPTTVALSHHYRDCERRSVRDCRKLKTTVDLTTQRFSQELRSAVVRSVLQMCLPDHKC